MGRTKKELQKISSPKKNMHLRVLSFCLRDWQNYLPYTFGASPYAEAGEESPE